MCASSTIIRGNERLDAITTGTTPCSNGHADKAEGDVHLAGEYVPPAVSRTASANGYLLLFCPGPALRYSPEWHDARRWASQSSLLNENEGKELPRSFGPRLV
jgi:hypothetical protein